MKVTINMSPNLLEMTDLQREDESRSGFICKIMEFTFIKAEFSWESIRDNCPFDCPIEAHYDILFDYVVIKTFGAEYPTDLLSQWTVEGKYGETKKFWFDKCIKAAIEKIEAEKEAEVEAQMEKLRTFTVRAEEKEVQA